MLCIIPFQFSVLHEHLILTLTLTLIEGARSIIGSCDCNCSSKPNKRTTCASCLAVHVLSARPALAPAIRLLAWRACWAGL